MTEKGEITRFGCLKIQKSLHILTVQVPMARATSIPMTGQGLLLTWVLNLEPRCLIKPF